MSYKLDLTWLTLDSSDKEVLKMFSSSRRANKQMRDRLLSPTAFKLINDTELSYFKVIRVIIPLSFPHRAQVESPSSLFRAPQGWRRCSRACS